MICPECGQATTDRAVCTNCGASLIAMDGRDSDVPREYVTFMTGSGVLNIYGVDDASTSDAPADMPAQPASGHLVVHLDAANWGSTTEFIMPLDGHEVTIGRSPGCTISLDNDVLVSRHHAIIRYSSSHAGYVITDLGSSNGTVVNTVPIAQETLLHEGDLIQIGVCEIIFSMASAPAQHLEASPMPSESGAIPAVSMPGDRADDPSVTETITMPPATFIGDTSDAEQAATVPGEVHPDSSVAASAASLASQSAPTLSAPPAPDLDAIQTQLTDMVGQLKRQAEAAAHEVERLQAEINAVVTTLATLVETDRQLSAAGPDLATLLQVTERTRESPRHLDNVVEFASYASEIGAALLALQDIRSSSGFVAAVDSLRLRLESLRQG